MSDNNGNHTEEIKDVVDQITTDAGELAREIRQKADDARKGMVKTLNDSALNLRQQTRESGAAEEVIKAVDDVAQGFEKAASYLHTHSVDDIRKDATKTAQQNSTLLIAIVLIIGVIIGLMLRGDDKK